MNSVTCWGLKNIHAGHKIPVIKILSHLQSVTQVSSVSCVHTRGLQSWADSSPELEGQW